MVLIRVCGTKAVGSGEAGEALSSPVFMLNSNTSALSFFEIFCSGYNSVTYIATYS